MMVFILATVFACSLRDPHGNEQPAADVMSVPSDTPALPGELSGRWVARDELAEFLIFPMGSYVYTAADSAATVPADNCVIGGVYREDGDWVFENGLLWLAMTRGDTQYPGTPHYEPSTGVLTCTGTKMVGSGGSGALDTTPRPCGDTWCFTIGPRQYVRVLGPDEMPVEWLDGAIRVHPIVRPVEVGSAPPVPR
jgi:hypothetical protein